MEELDFTKPQPVASPAPAPAPAAPKAPASQFYDPVVAGKVFRAFGRAEQFAAGATLFEEDQKVASGGSATVKEPEPIFLGGWKVGM